MSSMKENSVWARISAETSRNASEEPILASFLQATILNHSTLEDALSFHLANQLDNATASSLLLREVMLEAFKKEPGILEKVCADLCAVIDRDSACHEMYIPFLYFKGFHALETYRVANWLWRQGRKSLALFFQNRMSVEFAVDIHPAARLGQGIMLDHATGLVIGQTAVVGNNVSILQSVTLGGTGKDEGDRHPKIGDGVLISAGAKILGNICVGEGAKVGAGSVVLDEVPPHTTVAGVPAKIVGRPASDQPALEMEHDFCCDENAAKNQQQKDEQQKTG
ncbi:MAG: serine O-acetyltransferase [Alcanivorax sp.]|jgi:serine O-acetyltransferase